MRKLSSSPQKSLALVEYSWQLSTLKFLINKHALQICTLKPFLTKFKHIKGKSSKKILHLHQRFLAVDDSRLFFFHHADQFFDTGKNGLFWSGIPDGSSILICPNIENPNHWIFEQVVSSTTKHCKSVLQDCSDNTNTVELLISSLLLYQDFSLVPAINLKKRKKNNYLIKT